MLAATGGVNTHRGAIFSPGFGVRGCAFGSGRGRAFAFAGKCRRAHCKACGKNLPKHLITNAIRVPTAQSCGANTASAARSSRQKAGFPLAIVAKSLHEEYNIESNGQGSVDSWAFALLGIMAELEDNNALKRGGNAGARFVKRRAESLLSKRTMLTEAELLDFDDELIRRGISCGGAADMLAAAIFLSLRMRNSEVSLNL